jgi:hypothetical protein
VKLHSKTLLFAVLLVSAGTFERAVRLSCFFERLHHRPLAVKRCRPKTPGIVRSLKQSAPERTQVSVAVLSAAARLVAPGARALSSASARLSDGKPIAFRPSSRAPPSC